MNQEKSKVAASASSLSVGAVDSNKELSISKDFYRALLIENFEDFCVYTVNQEGKVSSWGSAAERMLGYQAEEVLGKEISHFYTPEDIKNGLPEQEIREAIQSGKGLKEQEHLRKDGSRFWASVLLFPIKNELGGIVGFTKVVRDISAFKHAEQKLQDALLYARSIVETVRGPLVVLDGKLRIKTANRAFYRIFRVSPGETEGQLIYDIGNRQWDIPQLRRLLKDIIPHGTSFDDFLVEHVFERIGFKIMLLTARAIAQESDHSELILLAFEDITERKQAETALEQEKVKLKEINGRLQNFNSMISHDIRSPLRTISAFVELLVSEHKSKLDDEAGKYLDEIRQGVARANNLVTDLLAVSKIEHTQNAYAEVNVLDLIKSALDQIGPDVQKDNVTIVKQENIPVIHCDPIRMKEVFVNLISNAIKFSAKQGQESPKVRVGYADKGSDYEFHVKDNGIGIAEEDQHKIFDMFKRLHSQDEFEGTGLGLHLVKEIIKAHNGRLWVNSKVGKGSTFYFTLPKVMPRNEAPSEGSSPDRRKRLV